MSTHYDIIIIGAGSGGLNMAGFARRIGLSVLLVDKTDENIGGDCLNFGCVPSKALLHVARMCKASQATEAFGQTVTGEIDIQAVMQYVKERQAVIREHENAAHFRHLGIEVILGEAQFASYNSITVAGDSYTGKRIIIATGSAPRTLTVPGSEHVPMYTNETIFDITTLPKHLLIVGGGPIGFELAQAFTRFGSKVTIINKDTKWLAKEHRGAAMVVKKALEAEGVQCIPNATLESLAAGNQATLNVDGKSTQLPADAALVSVGRTLALNLNLDAAGIDTDEQGKLVLNEYLQTTNRRVFAVGDVAGQHMFTHAAEVHVSLVASNFFKPRFLWKKLDTSTMAWVTYTDPELATFGSSEQSLTEAKIPFTTYTQSLAKNDRSITDSTTDGFLTVYVGKTGSILGGTMVGTDAGELVSDWLLAQSAGLRVPAVFNRIYPYPTASRVNKLLAGQYMSQKLTPLVSKILRFLY